MTRRELVRSVSAAALLLSSESNKAASAKKVVIGGAGIAGLSCAFELSRSGHEVTVLEASARVGGHVKTVREGLHDSLYVDAGAEQFTKPGYDLYWKYVQEFNLPYFEDHRRDHMMRRIGDRLYSEEELADKKILARLGFNQREIDYLSRHPWWDLGRLYFDKYTDAFADEYQPFGVGLDHLDDISLTSFLQKEHASTAAIQ